MATKSLFLWSLLLMTCARHTTQLYANKNKLLCPKLYHKVFRGYIPRGNTSAGSFVEIKDVKSPKQCVYECCLKEDCNVAFMSDEKCYHVACASNELCVPALSANAESYAHISMVLVRPAPGQDTWGQVLQEQQLQESEAPSIGREMFNAKDEGGGDEEAFNDPYEDLLQMDESALDYRFDGGVAGGAACNVGVENTCQPNEVCMRNYPKSRAGTCTCITGYVRSEKNGNCIELDAYNNNNNNTVISKKQLQVSAESKEVKLPDESEVSLRAVVVPAAVAPDKYQYEWTSLHKPEGSSGAVKQQMGEQLLLSKLSEGLYTFKVNVSGRSGAYGEAFVNVSVLAPSRINQPPQIIITPANQTIKLPNTGAVLDASGSTDDAGIVTWHWELQQGPIGYQPQLADVATLQLTDLTRPGNYTFKITVTDTDKATNTSTANITVLKTPDYHPDANAGQDVIIYLPHNQITLNGNLSTDDHLITTWEWTKSPDDADKAVDMQDTRTPYLRLSDLEAGMYTFVLKVMDAANQSSVAKVHVFVKPPTNQPPIARTSHNLTISLPQTWVVLDATNSTDDNKIIAYNWTTTSLVHIIHANASITNVTGLTKGAYVFKLSVTDDNNNIASALQYVTVTQNNNEKPKANAGGNLTISLPRRVVYINGSQSSDDWAVVRWQWTRVGVSLALGGVIAEGSDETPILILTNVAAGQYAFNLTVFDAQGLSDTDSVTVTVNADPQLFYLVDMTIDISSALALTHAQYNTLQAKLALLVQQDNTKLHVRGLHPEWRNSDRAIVSFYVEQVTDGTSLGANEVVAHLREKLLVDASLLGFKVTALQTAVCQNNCSGHGVCDARTRDCICEAFWMQDMFGAYVGGAESDCSWSILYVVLGVVCALIGVIGSVWGAIYLCLSRCSCYARNTRSHKPSVYKLIEDNDDLPPYHPRKGGGLDHHQQHHLSAADSDDDTDSDVVFESRNKAAAARFNSECRNGSGGGAHKINRNGFVKMGRRVKT